MTKTRWIALIAFVIGVSASLWYYSPRGPKITYEDRFDLVEPGVVWIAHIVTIRYSNTHVQIVIESSTVWVQSKALLKKHPKALVCSDFIECDEEIFEQAQPYKPRWDR